MNDSPPLRSPPPPGGSTRAARPGLGSAPALALAAALLAGCNSAPSRPPRSRGGAVDELHLFGVPVALNLDGRPGPDTLGLRIYASAAGAARGIPIRQGRLEVLMFDGTVSGSAFRDTPPLKAWTLDAAALQALTAETSLGTGYQLALGWGEQRPRGPVVTVIARLRIPGRPDLYSSPGTISVTLQ
ncbi:MAG: hypothetical protein ACKO3N_01395 [Verrucomicrobiota bacterium]